MKLNLDYDATQASLHQITHAALRLSVAVREWASESMSDEEFSEEFADIKFELHTAF